MGALPAEVITPPRSLVDITAPSSTLVATPTSLPESVVKPQASSTPLAGEWDGCGWCSYVGVADVVMWLWLM